MLIEGCSTTMRHNEDCSSGVLYLPRKENAVRHEWCLNPHDVEEALTDPKELRLAAIQTDSTDTRITWQDRV